MKQVTWMKTAAATDKKCLNSVCVRTRVLSLSLSLSLSLKMHAGTLENDSRCSSFSDIKKIQKIFCPLLQNIHYFTIT
jgi:hypothetical protein